MVYDVLNNGLFTRLRNASKYNEVKEMRGRVLNDARFVCKIF